MSEGQQLSLAPLLLEAQTVHLLPDVAPLRSLPHPPVLLLPHLPLRTLQGLRGQLHRNPHESEIFRHEMMRFLHQFQHDLIQEVPPRQEPQRTARFPRIEFSLGVDQFGQTLSIGHNDGGVEFVLGEMLEIGSQNAPEGVGSQQQLERSHIAAHGGMRLVVLKQLLDELRGEKFVMRVVGGGSLPEKRLSEVVQSGRGLFELEQAILLGNLHVEQLMIVR